MANTGGMLTSNGYVLDDSEQRLGQLEPVPVEERFDKEALWGRLRRDGYLYLKGQLDPAMVNDFRKYYFESLQNANVTKAGTEAILGIAAEGPVDRAEMRTTLFGQVVPGTEYTSLCATPAIADWFSWFLEDDVHLHKRKIIRHTEPGESGIGTSTQAHYDLVYLREGSDKVALHVDPAGGLPRGAGGLAYLEGSHHWVLAEERERGLCRARRVHHGGPARPCRGARRTLAGDRLSRPATSWCTPPTSCTPAPTTTTRQGACGCPPTSATNAAASPSTGAGRSTGMTRTDSKLPNTTNTPGATTLTLTQQENDHTPREAATLTIGPTTYQWESVWPEYAGRGWQHSGIAALGDGSVVFAHPEGGKLVRVFPDGETTEIATELTEMHGIATSLLNGEEVLWVADNGTRYCESLPEYHEELFSGRVVALGLDGTIRQELHCPELPVYKVSGWRPTTVDIDADTGNIWVGDGYGASLVHCFEPDGQLRLTLDGTESGTAFSSPHGIHLRRNGDVQELYVADRSNKRLVVFGLDGSFLRTVGEGYLSSPSSITDLNGTLLVTELAGALAVFDGDTFVGHAGASNRAVTEDAWPNQRDAHGNAIGKNVTDGVFNSPHGITVSGSQILLTEWMIGGRVTRLSPVG